MIRVKNNHTAPIEGIEPGAEGEVDESRLGVRAFLKEGWLLPVNADDVRLGAEDPMPSRAQVQDMVREINARGRVIEDMEREAHEQRARFDDLASERDALRRRVNELEAVLALRPGAPVQQPAPVVTQPAQTEPVTPFVAQPVAPVAQPVAEEKPARSEREG